MAGIQVEFLLAGLIDSSGQPLANGKVYTYSAGTTSDLATYTDEALLTEADNPIILDELGQAQVYALGSYKFVIKDSNDVLISTLDNLTFRATVGDGTEITNITDATALDSAVTAAQIRDDAINFIATAGGSANAITLDCAIDNTSYVAGQRFRFIALASTTGATTVDVDSLGAKDLKKYVGGTLTALSTGDIFINAVYEIVYDGTRFILLNPSLISDGSSLTVPPTFEQVRNDTPNAGGTVGGTANAITLTPTVAATSYATGMRLWFIPTANNTGATTVNVSGLGVKTIKRQIGQQIRDLEANDLRIGIVYEIDYNGTYFELAPREPGLAFSRNENTVNIVNTTTETTLFTKTIPGGTLSTDRALRITIFGEMTVNSGTPDIRFRIKYGSTTILDWNPNPAASGYTRSVRIEALLMGHAATNSQKAMFTGGIGGISGSTSSSTGVGQATNISMDCTNTNIAEDSTTDLTLAVTAQFSLASALNVFNHWGTLVEVV